MKKVGFSGVLGACVMLFALTVQASAGWSSLVNISNIEVDNVSTGNGTSTYFQFSTTPTGLPACQSHGAVVAVGSADHVKAMTALGTSAFLAGHQVEVYFDGSCDSGYAHFINVKMF